MTKVSTQSFRGSAQHKKREKPLFIMKYHGVNVKFKSAVTGSMINEQRIAH